MTILKKITTSCISAIVMIVITPSSFAFEKADKPTLAQIEVAKKREATKKKVADGTLNSLNQARSNLHLLIAVANTAELNYQRARAKLTGATKVSIAAANSYKEALAGIFKAHHEIGQLAVHSYISGGGLSGFEAVLSGNGPQDVADRLSTLENLGSANRTTLKRFKKAEDIWRKAKMVADDAKRRQANVTAQVAITRKEASDAQALQQKEVDKLQAVEDQLQRDLASAKKVRITLEQQRQLALLEEARANQAVKVVIHTNVWKVGGPNGKSTSRATEVQRLKAVDFAKEQVLAKKPYVWGSQGPHSFDCSGLVYAAYKYAGLGWQNWRRLNAALYYTNTKHIPISDMQPGDLIFYSYNGTVNAIHHITIYAGNGMMWEALSTGTGLRHSNVNEIKGMMPYAGRV